MEYRIVGRTGVKVSSLCFGTMSFGDTADEAESARMFRRCLDAGINFFDCANVYAGGRSEEILGDLMAELRDELIITSKVFGSVGSDVNARGLSRRHIVQAVEATLRRLKTDRLDFYFVHQFDYETPMEETIRALDELVRRGLVLYPAVSNWSAWQIVKALGVSERDRLARFELVQPMYNLTKRQAEVEILPMAEGEQLGVIPYSPLGGGLLTGKYGSKTRPSSGRLVENKMYMKRYGIDSYYEIAERFTAYAKAEGVHPATMAVAWVGSHPAVTAPIIGARNVRQLEPSLAAARFEMTPEMRGEIADLTPEVAPAHDRREERLRDTF
ncbi:MAG: aldo/keto reductase [Truepera sp.]|nr:aldo/keto reductase [Truepera sp.]